MADEVELSDEDGAEEFYFESDYLAIKSNKDYRKLVRSILILQVQRAQAIKVKFPVYH
jgi:ZZ-type zinc finger-containing protein 3